MILFNISTNITLVSNIQILSGVMQKSTGLIDQRLGSVFFQTRFGIHTFFMSMPILVLVLDDQMTIKNVKLLKPNSIFFWNPKYRNIIESTVSNLPVNIGDKLELR